MRAIMVYVEGGGNVVSERAELRQGFDALFKSQKVAAAAKGIRLVFVCCGSRGNAYKTFFNEHTQSDHNTVCVLLVDSEDEIDQEGEVAGQVAGLFNEAIKGLRQLENAIMRKNHLIQREPWDLQGIPPERIHLMVRCMESWIVADPEILTKYYGKDFHTNKLPVTRNLENVPKADLYANLKKATKETSKGEYAKIRHASRLLAQISSQKVKDRCPRFATFVNWIDEQICST
jgi:hypothetical protein